MTGSGSTGWTRSLGCGPRSSCRLRRRCWRPRRSIVARTIAGFVQVLMPAACEMMLGRSYYWPIWEAAARHGLPIGIHAGSMYRYAPTSTGWPSHYLHDYVANSQIFEDQLLSLISNGVFVKFPALRFVLIEFGGYAGCRRFLWRAVKTWRGVRAEVPWVNRSPADIIREHIRLTIATVRRAGPERGRAHRRTDRLRITCCCLRRIIRTGSSRATRSMPPGLSAGSATENAGGQSAGDLFSAEGDRVNECARRGRVTRPADSRARHHRLRYASVSQGRVR